MTPELYTCAHILLIRGIEKTGKTKRLIQRVAELVTQGVNPSDIIVFSSTPEAARALQRRLTNVNRALAEVEVTLPRAFALRVLDTPDARTFTGRNARMLARYEESFVMEDMRTTGIRPGRINDLMHFFYRGWTELADHDDHWLIFVEEQETHDYLKRILNAYRAFLEPEISNTALTFLAQNKQARASVAQRHVLVDDYQYLSRASQHLVNFIARDTITITANEESTSEVYESYPYPAGINEIVRNCKNLMVEDLKNSSLPAGVTKALKRLERLREQMTVADKSCESRDADIKSYEVAKTVTLAADTSKLPSEGLSIESRDTPAAECERVGQWVEKALVEGSRPSDIAIVVPNRTWERNIAKRLTSSDIPVRSSSESENIGGDVRYNHFSHAAQMATLITLAANPSDAAALRAWCGFGDYLTCRSLFSELIDSCQRHVSLAKQLANMLKDADSGKLSTINFTYKGDAKKASERLSALEQALVSLRGLTGTDFVQRVADTVVGEPNSDIPTVITGLLGKLPNDADAAAVAERLWNKLQFPTLTDTDGVALVTTNRAVGLEASRVALCALVNGFAPPRAIFDRTKTSPKKARALLTRCAMSYRPALSLGQTEALLLSFDTIRATDAERLGLSVNRFFIADGIRQARVPRSLLVDCIEGEIITVE